MLSDTQIQFYRDNGYLLVENVLTADEVRRLRAALDELIDRSRAVTASDNVFEFSTGHSRSTPRLRRIRSPELEHEVYADLTRHPAILDAVEALLGPNIRFHHGKLNIKMPSSGDAAIEWHQDWAFYPATNDDILAVGVYLDDCGPENGPLQVLPGSHKGRVLEHNDGMQFLGAAEISEVGLGNDDAIGLPGRAGSITIHHVRILHASRANTGDKPRLLMLNNYAAADAWPILGVADLAEFDAMMLRGEPTMMPRMEALPVRLPADLGTVSRFRTQEPVRGRSFGEDVAAAT